jgi:hypothetical protein
MGFNLLPSVVCVKSRTASCVVFSMVSFAVSIPILHLSASCCGVIVPCRLIVTAV